MDHIANMLVSILNAAKVSKDKVVIRHSKTCEAIVKILVEEGYCAAYTVNGDIKKFIVIDLKYTIDGSAVIRNMRRISKPSLRQYKTSENLNDVRNGMGLLIVSTNKGIMSGRKAKNANLGGEVLVAIDE